MMLLAPPAAKREDVHKDVHLVLADLQLRRIESLEPADELEVGLQFRQGKAALARYIRALREVRASHAALNPSIQEFLALKVSAILHDLVEADAMLKSYPALPRKRPPNKIARRAVFWARCLLDKRV
jgi:hypothetical protein